MRHRVHDTALTVHRDDAYRGARTVLETVLTGDDGPEAHAARRRGLHRLDRNQGLLWLSLGEPRAARRGLWSAVRNGPGDPHAVTGWIVTFLPGPVRRPVMALWKRLAPWVPWGAAGRRADATTELVKRDDHE